MFLFIFNFDLGAEEEKSTVSPFQKMKLTDCEFGTI